MRPITGTSGSSTTDSFRKRRQHPAKRPSPAAIWSTDEDSNDNGNISCSSADDDLSIGKPQSSKKNVKNRIMPVESILFNGMSSSSDDDDDDDDAFLKHVTRTSPSFQKKTRTKSPLKPPPPRVSLGHDSEIKQKTRSRTAKSTTPNDARIRRDDDDDDDDFPRDSDADDDVSSVDTAELVRRIQHSASTSHSSTKHQTLRSDKRSRPIKDTRPLPLAEHATNSHRTIMRMQEEDHDSLLSKPNDGLSSNGEQSVITGELTRHLLIQKAGMSAIRMHDRTTNSHQSLATATVATCRSSPLAQPLGDQDNPSEKDFLAGPEDKELSDGEDSTDTIELARRLNAKLGPRTTATKDWSQENQVPGLLAVRKSSTTTMKEPNNDATAGNAEMSRQQGLVTDDIASAGHFREEANSIFDEDLGGNDDDNDDDQSADTAELARRLRAKLCPSKQAPLSVPSAISATTRPDDGESLAAAGPGENQGSMLFRLPSQSSSSDDSENQEEDYSDNEIEPVEERQLRVQRMGSTTDTKPGAEQINDDSSHPGKLAVASSATLQVRSEPSDATLKPPHFAQAAIVSSSIPLTTANPYLVPKTSAPSLDFSILNRKISPRKMATKRPRENLTNTQGMMEHLSNHHCYRPTETKELSPPRNYDDCLGIEPKEKCHQSLPPNVGPGQGSSYTDEDSSYALYRAAFGVSPQRDALDNHHGHTGSPDAKLPASHDTNCRVSYEDAFGTSSSPTWTNNNRPRRVQPSSTNIFRNHQPRLSSVAENCQRVTVAEKVCTETFGVQPVSSTEAASRECVVLVDIDTHDFYEEPQSYHPVQPAPTTLVHAGLRTTTKSPRFNIVSRTFPKMQRALTAMDPQPNASDIEEFSDGEDYDETYRPSHKVARRVAEYPATRLRETRPRRLATTGNTTANAIMVEDSVDAPVPGVEQRSLSTGTSGLGRPAWRSGRKPRLRDAVASNPLNAASVAPRRKSLQQQTTFPQGLGRFATPSIIEHRQRIQTHRNDIQGGSGVGAGGIALVDNRKHGEDQSDKESISDDEGTAAASMRTSRKTATKKTAARGRNKRGSSKKTTSKKTKRGAKRGGWSSQGRGRGRRGSGGRGSWGGQRQNARAGGDGGVWGDETERGWKVAANFTREDPAMEFVGGAEIVF